MSCVGLGDVQAQLEEDRRKRTTDIDVTYEAHLDRERKRVRGEIKRYEDFTNRARQDDEELRQKLQKYLSGVHSLDHKVH